MPLGCAMPLLSSSMRTASAVVPAPPVAVRVTVHKCCVCDCAQALLMQQPEVLPRLRRFVAQAYGRFIGTLLPCTW